MKTLIAALVLLLPVWQQSPAPPPPSQPEYIVGPQDLLAVTVQGVAELTRDVIVDQDGTFDFPYIGRIAAAGKGVRAIETEIKSRLSPRYLVNPVVGV